ncbi:hypothetical protein KY285_023215 [Solanum tuberosum]|nr:hypothetical protein KY285_023215 [Solanum tuberosum]
MKQRKPRRRTRYKLMRELIRGRRKCRRFESMVAIIGGFSWEVKRSRLSMSLQQMLTIRDEPEQVSNVRKDGNTDLTPLGNG